MVPTVATSAGADSAGAAADSLGAIAASLEELLQAEKVSAAAAASATIAEVRASLMNIPSCEGPRQAPLFDGNPPSESPRVEKPPDHLDSEPGHTIEPIC